MTVKIAIHDARPVLVMMNFTVFHDIIHFMISMREELLDQNSVETENYLEIISEMTEIIMLMMVVVKIVNWNLGFLELMEHQPVRPVDMKFEGMEEKYWILEMMEILLMEMDEIQLVMSNMDTLELVEIEIQLMFAGRLEEME